MADVNTQIYQPLQAPQQQQLGPLQVLQLIGQMRQNQIQQQEFQSRQEAGELYNNNRDPVTGQVDYSAVRRKAPGVGILAPEITRQATENESATADLESKYQQTASQGIAELTTHPTISDDDLAMLKTRLSQQRVPGYVINKIFSSIPSDQKGRKNWASTFANYVNPQAATTLTEGNVNPVTGVRPLQRTGQVLRGASTEGGVIPELPKGVAGTYEEGQKTLVEDQKTAARTTANLRNLDIALPFVEKLNNANFGPGSPEFAKFKASMVTAGIIDPKTSDVTVRQELNKYLLKYATQAQNAGRSDQALGAAVGSNPNLDLTQPANLGLIKNQIGLDRMDAAAPKIFRLEHPGQEEAAGYNDYKSDYYDRFDRRVFSYDKMSPEERRGVISSLGGKNSPAYKKFEYTYQLAKKAGILVPDKQKTEKQ